MGYKRHVSDSAAKTTKRSVTPLPVGRPERKRAGASHAARDASSGPAQYALSAIPRKDAPPWAPLKPKPSS